MENIFNSRCGGGIAMEMSYEGTVKRRVEGGWAFQFHFCWGSNGLREGGYSSLLYLQYI